MGYEGADGSYVSSGGQHVWAEMRADTVKRKAALTMAGRKYQEQLKRPWRAFRW